MSNCERLLCKEIRDFVSLDRIKRMDTGWAEVLPPKTASILSEIAERLCAEVAQGRAFSPEPPSKILRAFGVPFEKVKVVIVGRDPYPKAGDANGLAFSVDRNENKPQALRVLFDELARDQGFEVPTPGNLAPWSRQGVMLLNRALTVPTNSKISHINTIGWEDFTSIVIKVIAKRGLPFVIMPLGKEARELPGISLLPNTNRVERSYPGYRSYKRNFYRTAPFTEVNDKLVAQGGSPIDWRLS